MSNKVKHTKPFLKWAGNKYRIIERILPMLPTGKRLIEPFAGSAAVFLNTDYSNYLICDHNSDLIYLYRVLQSEGSQFIHDSQRLFAPENNNADFYYKTRDEFNHSNDNLHKSILFLYLNRHGYNGLCRYNSKGKFNVPFGRYKKPYFPEREMRIFHEKAQHAEFVNLPFETVMQKAREGDVIYCDPPYVPLSASACFTSYSTGGFDLNDQQRLVNLTKEVQQRGIPVLISNHNTRFTREAYQQASNLKRFKVRRYISCNGSKRQHAGELLALFQ